MYTIKNPLIVMLGVGDFGGNWPNLTESVTRDYQKYGWPLPERWYGLDLRYNF